MLGQRIVLLWRIRYDNVHGRTLESTLIPISVQLGTLPRIRARAWVEELLTHVDTDVRTALDDATAGWRAEATRAVREFSVARIARERAILAANAVIRPSTFQPGLFDRRSERSRLLAAAAQAASDIDRAARLATMERDSGIVSRSADLLLVLLP